jgi:hypothetical protein
MHSALKQLTLVECPMAEAKKRLWQFLQHGSHDGKSTFVPLQFTVLAPDTGANVRMDVRARLRLVAPGSNGTLVPSFEVDWKSIDGGPYPTFAGELVVEEQAAHDETFWFKLEGRYDSPRGILGTFFDPVLGHEIAAASARALLSRIASFIEAAFASDERARIHRTPQRSEIR